MHCQHQIEKGTILYELVTSVCKTDGAEGATVYGMKVSSLIHDDIIFEDISVDESQVCQLIHILAKAQVEPEQLYYIVEDYIASL